jgi:hypothetical protein
VKRFHLSLALACAYFLVNSALAADTKFSTLETVDNNGYGTYSPQGTITVTGVVINNPYDMSDGTGYWQTYIQTIDPANDFGGTALYMGKWYGYSASVWASELNRLTYSGTDGKALGYGDVIQVTALAPGQDHNGQFKINEIHSTDPSYDFSIAVVQRGTTPTATTIDLSKLVTSGASGSFLFDQSRATGCEHFQDSLVHLDGLTLTDPSQWAVAAADPSNMASVTVQQTISGQTYYFPMILGVDPALDNVNAYTLGTFSVTAILDQEDGTSPYTGTYRLWLTNGAEVTPEPSSLVMVVAAALSGLLWWRRRARR